MEIETVIERDLAKFCDERLLVHSVIKMENTKALYKNVLLHDSCWPFEDGQLERLLKKPISRRLSSCNGKIDTIY